MFSKQMECILNFFDACAFNTGASKLFQNRKIKHLIFGIHILCALLLTVFKFHLAVRYYSSLMAIEAISESLQYSTALFTFWLIIYDSIHHRGAHKMFWKILQRINAYFCQQRSMDLRSFFLKTMEFFVATILALSIRITLNQNAALSTDIAYFILFEICQIRVFFYLFCLEMVHFQLKMIESEVKTMQCALNFISTKSTSYLIRISETSIFYLFEIQRLKWIREYFSHVYEMMNSLNETFGWSQVAAISFCFHLLLTEVTWIYIHFMSITWPHQFGLHSHLVIILISTL